MQGKIDRLKRSFLILPRHPQVRRISTWERAIPLSCALLPLPPVAKVVGKTFRYIRATQLE
jgi:hypothetical protein